MCDATGHSWFVAWPRLLLFGALGTGGYNMLVYAGLQHTTAINGTLLNSFAPIMIVLMSWLLQGKRLHRREAAGILVSFVGVLCIVAHGDLQRLRDLTLNIGDVWILSSVLAWSAYTLLLSRRPAVHPVSFLTTISATGLIFLLPFYLWEIVQGRHVIATPGSIVGILYSGIFPPSSATSCGIAPSPKSARHAPNFSCIWSRRLASCWR